MAGLTIRFLNGHQQILATFMSLQPCQPVPEGFSDENGGFHPDPTPLTLDCRDTPWLRVVDDCLDGTTCLIEWFSVYRVDENGQSQLVHWEWLVWVCVDEDGREPEYYD